jgi:hypothetical protein
MQSPARESGELELVGKGYSSDVYAWGEGRVLKLFHTRDGRERAEREYAATRAIHAAGLPVPAAHEQVEVEGRYGIVCERIDGVSLFDFESVLPPARGDAAADRGVGDADCGGCESVARAHGVIRRT